MNWIRKWVREIAAEAVAKKQNELSAAAMGPQAMDGKTEDGLLLCYAWAEKLIGAEDALRRVRLWQKEHDPAALPRGGSLYFEWATTSLLSGWMQATYEPATVPDYTLRDRIRQIALEADAEIKAASHKAAQKALKGAKK